MRLIPILLFSLSSVLAFQVRVRFGPDLPEVGPFPSDRLTVADEMQKTGLRVSLPQPDCDTAPGDCAEIGIVNQYDGFNVQARARIVFSGPVDPATLKDGVHYLWLDPAWPRQNLVRPSGTLTKANRVTWNPSTLAMTAKPDDVLEQGRRYAILVTDAIKDPDGNPVAADEGFTNCLSGGDGTDYCAALAAAAAQAVPLLDGRQVVGGSVFTTMSGSELLEQQQALLTVYTPTVKMGPVVRTWELQSLVTHAQMRADGEKFQDIPFPAPVYTLGMFGIDRIAFGSIETMRYLGADMMIPPSPTKLALPQPAGTEEIAFHVLLPGTPMPPGGYPVLLAGHGLGDNRLEGPSVLAYAFMAQGYAIVAINAVGHGHGPETTLRLGTASGEQEIPAPGRSVDLNGDGRFDNPEGCILISPAAPVLLRDCLRQTAMDWMAVARAIQVGIDLDGDGQVDLDGSKMSYWGQSLGAFYGTLLLATETSIGTGILNVGGASATETARISPSFLPYVLQFLSQRLPLLLNQDQVFDEQYVFRDQPARVLDVPGSAELQDVFERLEWIEASGAPSTYAAHLSVAPRDDHPAKNVLFQFAVGDQTVPNPSNSLLIRAAGGQAASVLYHHEIAREIRSDLPANPHAYFAFLLERGAEVISIAVLQQAAVFAQSGGTEIYDPNLLARLFFGADLFELAPALPEGTNYLLP